VSTKVEIIYENIKGLSKARRLYKARRPNAKTIGIEK
jgi:hypothetical protein